MNRRFDPRIVIAVLALLGSCGVAVWRTGLLDQGPRPSRGMLLARNDPAPELRGLSRWFNSDPLSIEGLRGKVVLVDFWTYSCINCIRTFPELRALYRAYRPLGLEIIGVHSPEFAFEKDPDNVARAVREREVVWPVAMDNDMRTWAAYRNRFWPHVYLIDHRGRIRFDRIGEGGGDEIETAVRALLSEAGATIPDRRAVELYELNDGITPEIYVGYERGEPGFFIGNEGGYDHDRVAAYSLPFSTRNLPRAAFFLDGEWKAGKEAATSAGIGASIVVPFTAKDVFVVGGGGTLEVLLDGKPIAAARAGADVRDGRIVMSARDLHRVVRLSRVESHELTLRVVSGSASIYTFTFG